ncbi:hypothetical protein BG011_002967 [Mortierella polycephala]|uniref:Uncharacterized protein n=1 Tax=Mortierella polycephala TaxID=41804 RepID=A0A9P6Q3C9_9FUNG|nr:hypothetical protein BG011_002967 [Mortierella polycephala]
MTASTSNKKNRRFSLIRLFNSTSSGNSSSASSTSSSTSSSPPNKPMTPTHYRHSVALDTMQTDMMRERRKSIATLTSDAPFRSMSLDLRPPSIRPILSRKETAATTPRAEMPEKMRRFDELLDDLDSSSTIRISLTPDLLQGP